MTPRPICVAFDVDGGTERSIVSLPNSVIDSYPIALPGGVAAGCRSAGYFSFTRFATSSSVANSPTLRVSLSSSPASLPLYSMRTSWS